MKKPKTYNGDLRNLPAVFPLSAKRWVCWRWIWKATKDGGSWTKPPYRPNGSSASSTDPATWNRLEDCIPVVEGGKADGIGMALHGSQGKGLFIDLDDCYDILTGTTALWAQQIVTACNSYTEVTPSGTGLRIIGSGYGGGEVISRKIGDTGVSASDVVGSMEIYSAGAPRYLCVTGNHLDGTPLEPNDISAVVKSFLSNKGQKKSGRAKSERHQHASEDELHRIIRQGAEVGERSEQFYRAVAMAKELGWTMEQLLEAMEANPDGIAAKYDGRLETELKRVWDKIPEPPWNDPQPLRPDDEQVPFPLDAIPALLRGAIEDVVSLTQAPVELVATCALTALSAAAAGIVDVVRDEKLSGPCTLFTLVLAESGERKSSVDGYFTEPLRQWEGDTRAAMKPELDRYAADLERWKAIRVGLREKAKAAARNGKSIDGLEEEMREHEAQKPVEPKVPRILVYDTTTEALENKLNLWPEAALISSEAGAVFGGHAMNKDNLLKTLSTYNIMWDGKSYTVDRQSRPSFRVENPRLTLGLAVQESVLETFMERAKDTARGGGFLSRFLICKVVSTQGTRFYKKSRPTPRLETFTARIKGLRSFDGDHASLQFSQEAQRLWIDYLNLVERGLCPQGKYVEVRDLASKSADNAARLACLLHVLERGLAIEIQEDTMASAAALAQWYLDEGTRLLRTIIQPQEVSDALKLSLWLRERGQKIVKFSTIQQFGPRSVRPRKRMEEALKVLIDAGHVRLQGMSAVEVNGKVAP